MRLLLIALAALPALAQDEDAVRKLIARLDDDNFEVREKAQKDLVRLGEAALPALKKAVADLSGSTDRVETRVRAEAAIREIDLGVKARQVYRDPRTLTLDVKDARLGGVLDEIGRQAGLRIDGSSVDRDARVTLAAKEAPLFQVLDDLCRGQAERTYEHTDEGQVRFKKERHVSPPARYGGPFRVRLVSLKQERSTDFADKKCVLRATLDADHEKYLKPLRRYSIEVERVSDDQGTVLEKGGDDAEGIIAGGGRVFVQAWAGFPGNRGDAPVPQDFAFKGLSPEAKSVALQGTLRYTFPLETREVEFDTLKAGERRGCGDYQARIEPMEAGGGTRIRHFTIHFEPSKDSPAGAADVDQRLETGSLVGIDEDGGEHRGQFHAAGGQAFAFRQGVRIGGDGSRTASYQAVFNTLRAKGLKKIKFRFIDSVLIKSVPFTFEKVDLP